MDSSSLPPVSSFLLQSLPSFLLVFPLHLEGRESDLRVHAHLRFCLVAHFFAYFSRIQAIHIFTNSSTYLKDRAEKMEKRRSKHSKGGHENWQTLLKENEFHRRIQFQIPVLLFPKSVRKTKALPTVHKISMDTVGKWKMHIIFSANYQRKIHTGRTETQIIISKLLAGNQINAWGFRNE